MNQINTTMMNNVIQEGPHHSVNEVPQPQFTEREREMLIFLSSLLNKLDEINTETGDLLKKFDL